jgi:cytochrome b subunit of formate dehydrogenase
MNDDIGTLIAPAPVQFSWNEPGWYVLGVLVLLVVVAVLFVIYRYWRRNKYRRDALSWLTERETSLMNTRPDLLVYDSTMLLKRIVMTRYGRKHATIRDSEWIAFLNSTCNAPLFAEQDARWLNKILYASGGGTTTAEVSAFLNKTKNWIKLHRHAL